MTTAPLRSGAERRVLLEDPAFELNQASETDRPQVRQPARAVASW